MRQSGTTEPRVRCPIAALVNGACTGCRYCENEWERIEAKAHEPRPDFDPRFDYPERYRDGPI